METTADICKNCEYWVEDWVDTVDYQKWGKNKGTCLYAEGAHTPYTYTCKTYNRYNPKETTTMDTKRRLNEIKENILSNIDYIIEEWTGTMPRHDMSEQLDGHIKLLRSVKALEKELS